MPTYDLYALLGSLVWLSAIAVTAIALGYELRRR